MEGTFRNPCSPFSNPTTVSLVRALSNSIKASRDSTNTEDPGSSTTEDSIGSSEHNIRVRLVLNININSLT